MVIGGFARQLFLRSLFSIVCRSISSLIYHCIILFYFSINLFHMISCCTLIILKLDPAEDDHEKERISVEEANRPFPVPKDGITFESLIRNRDEVEYFKEFLNKKHNRGEGKGLEEEGGSHSRLGECLSGIWNVNSKGDYFYAGWGPTWSPLVTT